MAIRQVFETVRDIAGMIAAGVMRLARWLFGSIGDAGRRLLLLQSRFPNVPADQVQQAYYLMEDAIWSARRFAAGQDANPPDLSPYLDPGFPTNYSYEATVTVFDISGRKRAGDIEVVWNSPDQLTPQQIDERAKQAAADQLAKWREESPKAWAGYNPTAGPGGVVVGAIWFS